MPETATEATPTWPLARTCPMAPPPAYTELRETPPRRVNLPDGGWAWLITRHEDVRQALMDPRFSSDDTKPGFRHRIQLPPERNMNSFWRMDEPEHGTQRHMVMTEFTARRIKEVRPRIQELVDELLDGVANLPQPVDLYTEFCLPLPTLVIARLLGVPEQDYLTFSEQSRLCLGLGAPEKALAAYQEMNAYLHRLADEKEREPADDLISRLIHDHVLTGALDRDDLVPLVRLILIGGFETTVNQIALSVLTLLTDPAARAALVADPEKMRPFIEESLRFWSVSHDNILRIVDADMEFAGVRMSVGDPVVVAIPAANHDPAVYDEPARFDIERDARKHLAFGHGAHLCPGAPLARREIETALSTLLARFPGLTLAADPNDLPYRHQSLVYGLTSLPVTW